MFHAAKAKKLRNIGGGESARITVGETPAGLALIPAGISWPSS